MNKLEKFLKDGGEYEIKGEYYHEVLILRNYGENLKLVYSSDYISPKYIRWVGIINVLTREVYGMDPLFIDKLEREGALKNEYVIGDLDKEIERIERNFQFELEKQIKERNIKGCDLGDRTPTIKSAKEHYFNGGHFYYQHIGPKLNIMNDVAMGNILEHIDNNDEFIRNYVDKYIEVNMEKIRMTITYNEKIDEFLQEIMADRDDPIHKYKEMADKIRDNPSWKSLKITIKGGYDDFKLDLPQQLTDYHSVDFGIYSADLSKSDASRYKKLARMSGWNESYISLESIDKITHGSTVVYEK